MTLAEQIELACLMEATARKPGNVHPGARFDDLCYDDFVHAAAASAPILAQAGELGVGRAVLGAVRATRAVCTTNVNLGICLLIAPLAAVPERRKLQYNIQRIVEATTVQDADLVYQAIRIMLPGGLGEAPEEDVASPPTQTLLDVMKLAADRDGIALEYASKFRSLRRTAVDPLIGWWWNPRVGQASMKAVSRQPPLPGWEMAVVLTHLDLIARRDTLIQRKCGRDVAIEASRRADRVLATGILHSPTSIAELQSLDAWLRADGHRRNPGTTADLIAACLFWAIREGYIQPPTKDEVLAHARQIASAAQA
jgi:triphosphoribosyl-dephospho-CoA synthase